MRSIRDFEAKDLRASHNALIQAGFSQEAATKVLLAEIQADAVKELAKSVDKLANVLHNKKF